MDGDAGLSSVWGRKVSLAAIRTSPDELTARLAGAGSSQCSHSVKWGIPEGETLSLKRGETQPGNTPVPGSCRAAGWCCQGQGICSL